MATNGSHEVMEAEIVDAMPTALEESQQELDAILDCDFSEPTELKMGVQNFSGRDNKAYQYYLKIKPRLPQWWEDFKSLDEKTGGQKYTSISKFALSRSKDEKEQQWIMQMIGTSPAVYNQNSVTKNRRIKSSGQWLKVPWLGDWKSRREDGYWAPSHPQKIKCLANALKKKLQGLDAVRSGAPYLVQMMATYMKVKEQVDIVFGGQALDLSKGPTPENKARFWDYMAMQKAVTRVQLRLWMEWCLANGVGKGDPVHVTLNQVLMGGEANNQVNIGSKELEAAKLARMLMTHADNFKMPLPEDQKPPVKESAPVNKTNGKVM